MTVEQIIFMTCSAAAVLWTSAGAIEFAQGHHRSAAEYAAIAALALGVDVLWRALKNGR